MGGKLKIEGSPEDFLNLVRHFPEAFPVSKKNKSCRLGLIHKNISIVYKIHRDTLFIVTLFDNRSKSGYR